jgi:hypothetical protein
MDNLAVVRGMSMETLTHEVGARRFNTGRPPSGLLPRGSSISTWLASELGSTDLIPNLSIGVEAYNVDQPTYATALRVATGGDLVRALRPQGTPLDAAAAAQIDAALTQSSLCRKASRSSLWQGAEQARQKSKAVVASRLDALFDIFASTPSMIALRDRFRVRAQDGVNSPEAQTAIAAQAITGGVSRVVNIVVTDSLDTHFQNWATDQGPRQQRGFDTIARLAQALKETPYDATTSYFDHTIIVGTSEFSRTPLLNATDGRDHHLTNSCFVLGGPVRGGVYGGSSEVGMLPQPMNLQTGALDDAAGEIVLPEHVLQALLDDAGVGDIDLRVPRLQLLRA